MKETVERKKILADKAENGTNAAKETAGVSNAAALAGRDSAASPNLGSSVAARLPGKMQRQIPLAESEADNLSADISASDEKSVKEKLGEKLGADFSNVRFHTGSDAKSYADSVGARAYTTGADVYFGDGGFDATVAAHELVHTVQQGAVGSETQTFSAPAGGIQMLWNPFKKKKKELKYTPQQAPGELALGEGERNILKGPAGNKDAASVEMVKQKKGEGTGVLKTQTNPELEAALADFYNVAGTIYASGKSEGDWSFDTAGVRGLGDDERAKASEMFQQGKLVDSQASSSGTRDEQTDAALNRMAIFSTVGGKSMIDPTNPNCGLARQYREKGAYEGTDDVKNQESYREMMGYVGVLDMVSGNRDRLYGAFNPYNWMEERDKKKMHLIDNVYDTSRTAIGSQQGTSEETMQAWKDEMADTLSGQPQGGKKSVGSALSRNIRSDWGGAEGGDQVFKEEDFTRGGDLAGAHLPQIYAELAKKYHSSSGGETNSYQKEMMQRIYEMQMMLDPEAQMLTPDEQMAKAKADALAEERAAFGGQTHGSRPTATSGPGWTKGTVSDWLGEKKPATRPQTTVAPKQTETKPAPEQRKWKKGVAGRSGVRIGIPGFGQKG